jgi:hypothetical protein
MEWKPITIGGEPTKYEMSCDADIRLVYNRDKPGCDVLHLVKTQMVKTRQNREREVVILFHNKALNVDLEALYVSTFKIQQRSTKQ